MNILVVDDNASLARGLNTFLEQEGHNAVMALCVAEACAAIDERDFDLIITDLKMPDGSGLQIVEHARSRQGKRHVPEFILMTAFGSVESAVEAMQLGVADYLTKPVSMEEFSFRINKINAFLVLKKERGALRKQCENLRLIAGYGSSLDKIVGSSPAVQKVKELIDKVARYNSTVLITGETGVGKEMVAKALHGMSPRHSGPFVRVNCASIPETLFESELFGHEKGAFTDARQQRAGKFEIADGGTLFLDEVGEIPLTLQAKLLRVLQEKEISRLGSSKTITVDVRIVAATNRNLQDMVETGAFREDLLYRLSVFVIHVPPLRSRLTDMEVLCRTLLNDIGDDLSKPGLFISDSSIKKLQQLQWPGNIRQLKNCLERAVILSEGQEVLPGNEVVDVGADLALNASPISRLIQKSDGESSENFSKGLLDALEAKEREMIESALTVAGGVKSRAAELLQIPRTQLLYRMKRLGIFQDEN